ncbi:MAG: hypothetical protein WCP21_17950 [Armatimonadota bacterium]
MKPPARTLLRLCVLLGLGLLAGAQAIAAEPERVAVGTQVMRIYDVDLKNCSYGMDFYIWFRWQGEADPRHFELMNGRLRLKEDADYREVRGVKYVSYHCVATMHGDFDFRSYPWDAQSLGVQVEDATHDTSRMIYVADSENSGLQAISKVGTWEVGKPRSYVDTTIYRTSYGNPLRRPHAPTEYSRFVFVIPVTHSGWAVFLKTFLALFISVAIACLAFLVRADELEPRFGVGIAGTFGAVSSQLVLESRIADGAHFTFADQVHHLGLIVVFLSLLQSCISLRLWRAGKEVRSQKLDAVCALVFPLAFTLLVLLAALLNT